ncbi:MAG TPA: methyltransferase domain-containing protein, partial [Chroococcidiopsis sp.]
MTTFNDYFSTQASDYAKYRPTYPEALFDYLAGLVTDHDAAWDCATGNGQVAVGLTPFFQTVYATDASADQITHAFPHPQIRYAVATAEASGLPSQSVDLVTVGLALHWL